MEKKIVSDARRYFNQLKRYCKKGDRWLAKRHLESLAGCWFAVQGGQAGDSLVKMLYHDGVHLFAETFGDEA